jgi:hypothetical protein
VAEQHGICRLDAIKTVMAAAMLLEQIQRQQARSAALRHLTDSGRTSAEVVTADVEAEVTAFLEHARSVLRE